ncbi:tape measure protein [Lactiplantibacillus plantarum]|uniref:tape measure protein n=1 Tax=Lactiplantibacillus plantarum TaxID=1590 RepID=UPI002ADD8AEA|nr:tape measure protein [Lactiplantibacillus plantarum]MEA0995136.1 tape measure protein [Lactiplantibacillus plantarum]MEA1034769.1 tape measure protein [Lactiplantibacillus plantarum]
MADGTVTIDVLMGTKSFMSDRERVENLLKTLGSDAGNQMDESFAKNSEKVKTDAEKTHKKVKKEFSDPVVAKLEAKANEAGVKNFKSLLTRIPRNQLTRLKAKSERGEVIDWKKEISRIPEKKSTKLKVDKKQASDDLTAFRKQSESTEHSFSHLKEIVAGTFLGGAIQAGVLGLVSGLKDAAKAGMEYNKEQDTMKTVWTALTTEAPKDGKELVDYINSLSQHSIYAADTINLMAQSFYHVHSNVEETKRWTDSFVALGSTLHMSNDALAESGEQFAKIVAGGKASAEDMSVMINRFPMFGEALQKATGKSMKQLYAMSAAGKLTATQFTEALDYLGKKYKGGTAEAMTSFQGMSMYIKSRWSVLTGNIMASSFKMSKGVAKDMRNLLSDDMMKKYAKLASGAISTVMDWFVKLIKYIDGHKDTIVDIIGNLGKILGIIGKTVWKTFSDIIYDIARMFGLVGKKAQDSKDPLDKIDDALKNLSKNQELIENLTKAFIAMFALKKGLEFIGMLSSLRKSLIETAAVSKMVDLFGGGGFTGGGGKAVAKEAGSSKAFGRLFSKGGATSTAELEAASGLGGGSKLLSGLLGTAKSTAGLSAIASLPELLGTTRKTAGEHVGGYVGSTGGSIAGAAVGSLLGPVGTLAGGALGGYAGAAIGKSLGKDIQKGLDANKPKIHVIKPGKIKLDVSTDTRKVESNLKSYQKKLSKKVIVKMAADPSSYAKTKTETDKLFNGMRSSVDKYYKNKESKSKQDLDKLVKNGSMTQAEENKILKAQQTADAKAAKSKKQTISKMQADTSNYYSKVQKIENGGTKNLELIALKYGRNSKQYEKEKNKELASAHKAYISKYTADEYKLNTAVTKSVEKGSKEQKSILQKLLKDRGKLNLKDLKATQENADKKYNAAVKPARKTRDEVIDSATDQYRSTKKTADHEYYDLHAISKKQHDDIVSKAKKQRNETSDAANDQYKKVTKHASDQHKSVTNEIEHQRKEVTKKQQDQQADAIAAATGQSKEVVRHQMRQSNSSMSAADKQGSGLHGIWKGITGFFNGLVKGFGIKPINVGAYPSGYTPVSMGAYASGGTATSSQALVGEGGVEARISKSSGRVDFIGTNGAEVVDMQPGDQILNAADTAQLFNGGLGRTLPGYASGTIDVAGFLKKAKNGAASMFENISETASDAISKITDPVKTMTDMANKIFNPGKTGGVGSIGHDLGKAFVDRPIKAMADVISKIISSIADGGDDGAGSLAPHFGSPFKESSGYGPRSGGFHKGIDFAAPLGTPIPAQYGGTVVQAGPASGFGNWVVIKPSGASVDTIYGHMKRMKVKTGQHVKAGQIIAWVGSEGQSSGPHVHYELRAGLGGKSYNPMTYGASAGNPSGHSVNRWRPYVVRALKANGFAATASQVAAWMEVIRRESNGDPSVINTWDPNAKAGHPSMGLVQTIRPTFEANKFKDHNNPLNGYDDLLAGIHYMKAIYGSGPNAFARVSGPMGYDSGGRVMKKQLAWLAENNPEYVVNPERDNADSLIVEVARARAAKAPNGLIAKAMQVVGAAKAGIQRTAPSFASRGVSQAEGQFVGSQTISGDVTITVPLDSGVLAQAVYPKTKLMQQRDITIQAKKGGLH